MNEYMDILTFPHYELRYHERMSLENRAAQFAPFAALNGHNSALMETEKQNEQMYEHQDDSSTFTEFQYENGEDFL